MNPTSDTAPGRPLRIAVVFGGRSGEHEVSVVSARFVSSSMDPARYEVVPMAIDRHGLWADPATARRVLESSGDRTDAALEFNGGARLDPRLLDGAVDAVFPVLHGPYGEDGTIQGMLEMLDLPYVGCDVTASALCMDKVQAKRVVACAGLPTAPWVEVAGAAWRARGDEIRERCLELGLPLFVKPVRLGSSVGISKVSAADDLDDAVTTALTFDDRAIVERGLEAREIEVAVLGNEQPRASLPGEVVPGHEFYDFDDKYVDDACELLAPAPLDQPQVDGARELAVQVFRLLGCEGMARVDLFLERATGRYWVNEVNSIPGFTSISMYPRLWGLSGLEPARLVDELIRLAQERKERRQRHRVRR